jgi:hypothetical protein
MFSGRYGLLGGGGGGQFSSSSCAAMAASSPLADTTPFDVEASSQLILNLVTRGLDAYGADVTIMYITSMYN